MTSMRKFRSDFAESVDTPIKPLAHEKGTGNDWPRVGELAAAPKEVKCGSQAPLYRNISANLWLFGVAALATGGATALCQNANNQISTCSSSLRYETDVVPFGAGLEIIKRLRPISFTWKQSGIRDLGFAAEEVAQVEPLFTFTNDRGEVEGVKYDRLSVVLVNAVKELKQENDQLKEQNAAIKRENASIRQQQQLLQAQFQALKQAVCKSSRTADLCKP